MTGLEEAAAKAGPPGVAGLGSAADWEVAAREVAEYLRLVEVTAEQAAESEGLMAGSCRVRPGLMVRAEGTEAGAAHRITEAGKGTQPSQAAAVSRWAGGLTARAEAGT